jgi:hypothetical protein
MSENYFVLKNTSILGKLPSSQVHFGEIAFITPRFGRIHTRVYKYKILTVLIPMCKSELILKSKFFSNKSKTCWSITALYQSHSTAHFKRQYRRNYWPTVPCYLRLYGFGVWRNVCDGFLQYLPGRVGLPWCSSLCRAERRAKYGYFFIRTSSTCILKRPAEGNGDSTKYGVHGVESMHQARRCNCIRTFIRPPTPCWHYIVFEFLLLDENAVECWFLAFEIVHRRLYFIPLYCDIKAMQIDRLTQLPVDTMYVYCYVRPSLYKLKWLASTHAKQS